MPQPLPVISRTLIAASFVAVTVLILAVGVFGSEGSGSECMTTGPDTDFPSLGTPTPAPTQVSDAGSTALDAPGAATMTGCGAAVPSEPTSPSVSAAASAAAVTIEVEARDPYFSPTEVGLPAMASVRLVLTNAGYVTHNLTVDELGIQLVASRGGTAEVTLDGLAAGTYAFYCSVSGHREAGMEGTLRVG